MKKQFTKRILSMVLCLCMVLSMIPVAMAEDYPAIALDEAVTVTLDGVDVTSATFTFIPEQDGTYFFYSYSSDHDTYGYILDANGVELTHNDDYQGTSEFGVQYDMTAGTTYLLQARFFTTTRDGSMNIKITRPAAATSLTLDVGDTYADRVFGVKELDYSFGPENCLEESVTWSSSEPTVVNVDDSGILCLQKVGTAVITATSENGLTASCTVTVADAESIVPGTEYATDFESYSTAVYRFTPDADGIYGFSIYGSANEITGRIYNESGGLLAELPMQKREGYLQQALNAGQTYYFVTKYRDGGYEDPYYVRLAELSQAAGMTLNAETLNAYVGNDIKLTPVFTPADSIIEACTWKSSDEAVATVDADGVVTFYKAGSVTVTATSENGFTASCVITVADRHSISRCEPAVADIVVAGSVYTFYFTPEQDGTYAFSSSSDYDTYGHVYDATGETLLAENDDGGEGVNFRVTHAMTAGTTYQLKAKYLSSAQVGALDVMVQLMDENDNVIHNYNEDNICACGEVFHECDTASWIYDATEHWGYCDVCDAYINYDHSLDEDGNCVCGYYLHDCVVSSWYYDEIEHWGYCDICDSYLYFDHSYGEDGKCACGYFEHTHDSDGMDYDQNNHWQCCSQCGLNETDYAEHTYGEDSVCDICGREPRSGLLIADVLLNDGDYMDNAGNVTTQKPAIGYAYYKAGVLTLHNFVFEGTGIDAYENQYLITTEMDLELKLEGRNTLECTEGDGLYVAGANLTVSGDGLLQIYAAGSYDGIDVNGGKLTVNSGILIVDGTDHGIEVYGDLEINDGIFIVKAGDDGFDINGDAVINGGIFRIEAEDNGIDCYYDLTVNGGSFYIWTEDDNGMEASEDMVINGGVFEFDVNDDAINGLESVTINGGIYKFNVGSTDAAILSDNDAITFGEAMGQWEIIFDENNYSYAVAVDGVLAQDMSMKPIGEDAEMILDSWITLSATEGACGGKDITPTVTVVNGDGETLAEGTDYTVSWSEAPIQEPGAYVVTVSGIGDYTGKQVRVFRALICSHTYVDGICTICGAKDTSGEIKWQLNADTTAEDATAAFRLISFVDTLEDYSKVVFTVSFMDAEGKLRTADLTCTTAYEELIANGQSIGNAAGIFGESANYFVTYTINGWPQAYYDTDIAVIVTRYDLNGEVASTAFRSITLSDAM